MGGGGGGLGVTKGSCGGERRVRMMTFISEMRKGGKKTSPKDWDGGVAVMKGGRKSGREEEEEGKKNRLAWLQSKRAEEDSVFSFFLSFFFPVVALTPGSGSDRRVVYANEDGARVFMSRRALSQGPSVSVSQGRGEDVGEGPRGS